MVADPVRMDSHYFGKLYPDPHYCLKMEPWTLIMEAWRLKMEPWRVCRPVFADSSSL
jgi:hypothetical protein